MSTHLPATVAVLDQLLLLITAARTYGVDHPGTIRAAESLAASIQSAGPPFALQFVVQAVFRDRELVPIDADRYDRVMALGEALHRGGAQELAFGSAPRVEDLAILGDALAATNGKTRRVLDELSLGSVSFREVPDAQPGAELETVEPEIFIAAQVVLALRAARRATLAVRSNPDSGWLFSAGMEAVRRLERGLETHSALTASTLEVAPGQFDIARRALIAAHHVAAVCQALEPPKQVLRASIHAALIIAAVGLTDREGLPFAEAATKALFASIASLGGGADPHRYLVVALLRDVAAVHDLELGRLIQLSYELEYHRRPANVEFDLDISDLLSQAIKRFGDGSGPEAKWVRLRVTAAGAFPSGARVRLSDGRCAIVLGPGTSGDPRLPSVLVNGQKEELSSPPALEGTPRLAFDSPTRTTRSRVEPRTESVAPLEYQLSPSLAKTSNELVLQATLAGLQDESGVSPTHVEPVALQSPTPGLVQRGPGAPELATRACIDSVGSPAEPSAPLVVIGADPKNGVLLDVLKALEGRATTPGVNRSSIGVTDPQAAPTHATIAAEWRTPRRDPRRDSTGPRLAPVAPTAISLLTKPSLIQPSPKKRARSSAEGHVAVATETPSTTRPKEDLVHDRSKPATVEPANQPRKRPSIPREDE